MAKVYVKDGVDKKHYTVTVRPDYYDWRRTELGAEERKVGIEIRVRSSDGTLDESFLHEFAFTAEELSQRHTFAIVIEED